MNSLKSTIYILPPALSGHTLQTGTIASSITDVACYLVNKGVIGDINLIDVQLNFGETAIDMSLGYLYISLLLRPIAQ